jgi:hypothetical protein
MVLSIPDNFGVGVMIWKADRAWGIYAKTVSFMELLESYASLQPEKGPVTVVPLDCIE